MHEDAELARKCAAGDQAAFADVYEAHFRRIYSYAYRRAGQKELAEDLTSQAFAKAFAKISSYDAAKGSLSAWLHGIARTCVADHYRASLPTVSIEEIWDIAANVDVAAEADRNRTLSIVWKHMETLSASQREILRLRLWEDLPYEEIAAITGKTPGSCKMAFSRAIKRLRQELAYLAAFLLCFINL